MRRIAAGLVLSSVLASAVTACSSPSSPAAELQSKMNAIATASNDKDAAALRSAVDEFVQEVLLQSRNGDITATRAQALRNAADKILADAHVLEQAPSPAATSEAPSPAASPSPSPKPSPSPSPSPSPLPSPTEVGPPPSTVPPVEVSSSPGILEASP